MQQEEIINEQREYIHISVVDNNFLYTYIYTVSVISRVAHSYLKILSYKQCLTRLFKSFVKVKTSDGVSH